MYGSSSVRYLPSCNTYEGAVRIFERAARKPTPNWPLGKRPLGERRQTQYAVIREGSKVVFRLHQTNVVEWYGPTSMMLDSSWDSRLTRDFADNFIPAGIRFRRYQDEGYVLTYDTDKMMCRGTHIFKRQDNGVWLPEGNITKPRRTVVDKDQAAMVNEKLRDFVEWAKALWAVSGSDGHHPWVNLPTDAYTPTKMVPREFTPEQYETVVRCHLHRKAVWKQGEGITYRYQPMQIDAVLRSVRVAAYKLHDGYIKIDYDAPLPRRTKK